MNNNSVSGFGFAVCWSAFGVVLVFVMFVFGGILCVRSFFDSNPVRFAWCALVVTKFSRAIALAAMGYGVRSDYY